MNTSLYTLTNEARKAMAQPHSRSGLAGEIRTDIQPLYLIEVKQVI
jgi:hypothetical protein